LADEGSVYFANENLVLLSYKDKKEKIKIIDQELYETFQKALQSLPKS